MANDPKLTTAAANAAADAVVDLIDAGDAGLLRIYSGSVPATANTALDSQTLLAELTFSATAFGSAAAGVATAASITSDESANATGTATFFRVTQSDGTVVFQGTVGTTDADLEMNSVSIQENAEVAVTAFTYTQPLEN